MPRRYPSNRAAAGFESKTPPLVSITSTASAMLLKVFSSTDCAAPRCSSRTATSISRDSFSAFVALSELVSARFDRYASRVRKAPSIRINATPTRSVVSSHRPLHWDCAVRTASSRRSSAVSLSRFAESFSIAVRPSALDMRSAIAAVSCSSRRRRTSALAASRRVTMGSVLSSNSLWAGLSLTAAFSSAKAVGTAALVSRNSFARFGSFVTEKPRAALSALRTSRRRSVSLFRTSSVCSTQAASARDLTSIAIEAALITRRIAKPMPRMRRWYSVAVLIARIAQLPPVQGRTRRSRYWRYAEDVIRWPNTLSDITSHKEDVALSATKKTWHHLPQGRRGITSTPE